MAELKIDVHTHILPETLPDLRERFAAEGTTAAAGTPAQFADLVRREVEQWRAVVKQASITLD